jgi:glycine/D-amino acid oxidase-like deaminating enzyme
MKIVVVGAGIVGASVAYNLARRGAAVTLVDRGEAAGGVTGKAFGWINIIHSTPEANARLRHLAVREYRRLEADLGGALPVNWCGALTWLRDPAETERFARAQAARGYDVRLVDRDQLAVMEPKLRAPPEIAAHATTEGGVDPATATRVLVRAAREAGAEVRLGSGVLGLITVDKTITGVDTGAASIAADVVVLAAGSGTRGLCAPLGLELPVQASPAILMRFSTPQRLVNAVISNPDLEVRQAARSRLLAAADYIDDSAANGPEAVARRTLARIREGFHGAAGVALEEVEVGWRPMPADGLSIVGFTSQVDGLYLAVMHAGVTLAPAIGRLAASEILDGEGAAELEPCRPERFALGASGSHVAQD